MAQTAEEKKAYHRQYYRDNPEKFKGYERNRKPGKPPAKHTSKGLLPMITMKELLRSSPDRFAEQVNSLLSNQSIMCTFKRRKQ